jgi:hypothetical protein
VAEKLSQAVHSLAVGRGDIQDRLVAAALAMQALEPDDFTEEDGRAEFEAIWSALTADAGVADEDSIAATTNDLDDDQAVELAERIVALEARLSHSR